MQSKSDQVSKKTQLQNNRLFRLVQDYFDPLSKDTGRLNRVNKEFNGFFNNYYQTARLMKSIASGNQQLMTNMISNHPELLTQKVSMLVGNMSLKKVSPFEFILWTMDVRYMGAAILNAIHASPDGDAIRNTLLLQYSDRLSRPGISYRKNNTPYTEQYFDYAAYANALQSYIDNYDARTEEECMAAWLRIGIMQRDLPTYIRQHYCDSEVPFTPEASFQSPEFNRNLRVLNLENNEFEEWTDELEDLGTTFAISYHTMGETPCAAKLSYCPTAEMVQRDLDAFKKLIKTRLNDENLLIQLLKTPGCKLVSDSNPKCI
ncbi:hypothetical protein [Legionella waltersii]|uniref:SidC N-terminal domain-containing protein n=1 Tax=Legionella waltersii TaxID=66969 RepID=A0A0W1ANL7_9GAMM|nr:hypothetical protein [Legionella waltersii]KTD82934.1 hypothetical protein Lwal_0412 [Legionella waltersii]SNV02395.1 SidC homolog [Legionella waltersii]